MHPNRTSRSRRSAIVILGAGLAVAAAMGVAAIAARQGLGRSADQTRFLLPDIPTAFYYLVALLEIVGLVALVLATVARKREEEELDEPSSRGVWWSRALALVLLLGLLVLSGPLAERLPEPGISRDTKSIEPPAGDDELSSGDRGESIASPSLGIFLTVLLALLIVGLVVALFFMFSREEKEAPPPEERPTDHLTEEVEAGIDDLESIQDPRRAVIACYARMQRLLPSAGIESRASDTPFELLTRILEQRNLPRRSISTLTESFERAKFSRHSIGESTRTEALTALRDIRGRLASRA